MNNKIRKEYKKFNKSINGYVDKKGKFRPKETKKYKSKFYKGYGELTKKEHESYQQMIDLENT